MASRYFRSCRSGLYRGLKVTILNDLVSRSKRPFDDFQEGEQDLQPDVKKQRCGSPFLSQKIALASAIPSPPSNGIAGSQVYSVISGGDYDDDDDDTLLEPSDGEYPDSPSNLTLEQEDMMLAEDPSDVLLGFSVKEVGSGFAEASLRVTLLQSVPRAPDASPDPLPPTGLSVPSSGDLPHSSASSNPERGSSTNVDSQNQTGLSWIPDGLGLQGVMSIEAGSFSLKQEDSGSGIVDKEATPAVGEESPVVSQLMAECEFASVATDRPSEGQAFIEQSEVGGGTANEPPCETQGESDSAAEVATEHSVTAPNEDRIEDPGPEDPENPSPEEPEDPSPDDPRRSECLPLLHASLSWFPK